MLSFKDFEKYINYIKREQELCDGLYSLARQYNDIVQDSEPGIPRGSDYIIELIEVIMDIPVDEFGYSALSWWIYETEFGKKEDSIFENTWLPDDHKYHSPKLKTYKELYDYLVWESEEWKKRGEPEK